MQTMEFHDVVELMQMEYAEMPELKLTLPRRERRWLLQPAIARRNRHRALVTYAAAGATAHVNGSSGVIVTGGVPRHR